MENCMIEEPDYDSFDPYEGEAEFLEREENEARELARECGYDEFSGEGE